MSKLRIAFSLFVLAFMVGAIGFCVRTLQAAERSSHWGHVRKVHIETEPYCALCGTTDDLDVHHIVLFSQRPDMELHATNLITLCGHCHWQAGHLGIDWKIGNDEIREIVRDTGRRLYEKRLAILEERRKAKEPQP